jgi:hypothetical protein
MLAWYRALIRLRHLKSQWQGCMRAEVEVELEALWLKVLHAGVLATFNFAAAPQPVPMPLGSWRLVLHSDPEDRGEDERLGAGATRVFAAP